jgi:mitochondrial cardiolipin hydrolase
VNVRMYLILCIMLGVHALGSADDPVPPGFGSTHFIVGNPAKTVIQPMQRSDKQETGAATKVASCGRVKKILFAPDDDVCAELLGMIEKEKKIIKVAIFLLTDERIAQALVKAHERGVQVEVVVDPKHLYDRFSRVQLLCKNGIDVFVFNPKYGDPLGTGLMHDKFVIFGLPEDKNSAVWAGSYNFTRAAGAYNQEYVCIVQGTQAVDQFSRQFACLKGRCAEYSVKRNMGSKIAS